ncbi:MAG: hypothetical protein J7574_15840 [Flavobacterium sp.]|uniref:hypothetical protein n=1 Tax=Flavobacterium sp. TaxID=239 RepID=UPI001B12CB72|nr:hypothetical protein [Flavobacterium sp.]MBO9585637.1 hypothetical protein [Flavobacterium sp.]
MKSLFSLLFGLALYITSFAQSSNNYQAYTTRIAQFSKPSRILYNHVDAQGNGYIEFTNPKNQILRFRLKNHKIQTGSCNIAFEIYYYENSYLKKIESFDSNGKLIGCNLKLHGEAVIEYTIEKPELYLKKKKLIDDAEGNIDMKDDSNEKIIRVRLFDSSYQPITRQHPSYISSKEYWQNTVRMSWP